MNEIINNKLKQEKMIEIPTATPGVEVIQYHW